MSHRGIEVTEFIGANERHLQEGSQRKPAMDLAEGDIVRIPGSELHDDLVGLTVTMSVGPTDRREGRIYFSDDHGNPVWFREGEEVRIDPTTYASSRLE